MAEKVIISVDKLVKKFGSFTANHNLSFRVYTGEIFGFLGPNGAGKTTAVRILCGLLKPTSGVMKVAGYDVYTESEKIKKSIGYMSQGFSLYQDLTVYENMRFYGGIYGMTKKDIMNRIDYFLHKLDLEDIRNKQVKGILLGWRQKLAFCVAILHDPPLVFLDEPTSGVDPVTRRQFWNMIYETAYKGTTVFITTHYMDEAEYCTRVSIMKEGEIKALDKPKELKKKFGAENMNQVFLNIAGRDK